jgi:hypothetical protein
MASSKGGSVSAPSLNVYKKVSVIRKSNDTLTYEDVEGTVKSLSIKELGDAIATAVRAVIASCVAMMRCDAMRCDG